MTKKQQIPQQQQAAISMKIIGPMRPILGYPIGQSLELEPLEPSRPPPNKKSNGLVMIVFQEYFSVEKKNNSHFTADLFF